MQIIFRLRKYCFLLTICMSIVMLPQVSVGKLSKMNEDSMKETVGQVGYTDFSMNDNTARLFVDIHIETIGEIGTFSAGHPSNYDLDFDAIEIGDARRDIPLTIDGLVVTANFDDDNNLRRVVVGSNMLNGTITARMNKYTGVYNDKLITGNATGTAVEQDRMSVGNGSSPTTFTFNSPIDSISENDMGMFFVLTNNPGVSGAGRVGFRMVAGYNETAISASSSWWDQP